MVIQKSLTWATAVLENLMFSGAFYGWANLYPVLQSEGYFAEDCLSDTNITTVGCKTQDEALSLVYSIASSMGLISGIFFGAILDYFGMWCARTIAINMALIAYFVTAISTTTSSYLLYLTFPLINFSGFSLMILNSQLTNIYPSLCGLFSTGVGKLLDVTCPISK